MKKDKKGNLQPENLAELIALTPLVKGSRLLMINLKKISFTYFNSDTNTSIIIKDFTLVLDNYSITHVLKKHGNHQIEKLRGQLGVMNSDFNLLEKLITEADSLEYLGLDKSGNNDLILFKKVVGAIEYNCIQEIRTKKDRVCLKTLYKKTVTI